MPTQPRDPSSGPSSDHSGDTSLTDPDSLDVVKRLLSRLHHDHPEWSLDTLLADVGGDHLSWLHHLAHQAGFAHTTSTDCDQRILALANSGVWSDLIIADEIGLPLAQVRAVLAGQGGYGEAAYGHVTYGGRSRRTATENTLVMRRVSIVGQMSYRNCVYTLGRPYRGRVAALREHGPILLAAFGDRPSLHLTARHCFSPPHHRSEREEPS